MAQSTPKQYPMTSYPTVTTPCPTENRARSQEEAMSDVPDFLPMNSNSVYVIVSPTRRKRDCHSYLFENDGDETMIMFQMEDENEETSKNIGFLPSPSCPCPRPHSPCDPSMSAGPFVLPMRSNHTHRRSNSSSDSSHCSASRLPFMPML